MYDIPILWIAKGLLRFSLPARWLIVVTSSTSRVVLGDVHLGRSNQRPRSSLIDLNEQSQIDEKYFASGIRTSMNVID